MEEVECLKMELKRRCMIYQYVDKRTVSRYAGLSPNKFDHWSYRRWSVVWRRFQAWTEQAFSDSQVNSRPYRNCKTLGQIWDKFSKKQPFKIFCGENRMIDLKDKLQGIVNEEWHPTKRDPEITDFAEYLRTGKTNYVWNGFPVVDDGDLLLLGQKITIAARVDDYTHEKFTWTWESDKVLAEKDKHIIVPNPRSNHKLLLLVSYEQQGSNFDDEAEAICYVSFHAMAKVINVTVPQLFRLLANGTVRIADYDYLDSINGLVCKFPHGWASAVIFCYKNKNYLTVHGAEKLGLETAYFGCEWNKDKFRKAKVSKG